MTKRNFESDVKHHTVSFYTVLNNFLWKGRVFENNVGKGEICFRLGKIVIISFFFRTILCGRERFLKITSEKEK